MIEDPRKYKLLGDIRTKKQVKLSSAESSLKSAENVKRNREEFRRSLVDIIMHEEGKHAVDSLKEIPDEERMDLQAGDDPKNIEKDILRYYYYIHNGIDTEHVAPLENVRLQNVMSLITEKLRKTHQQTLVDLSDEVREDYLLSVKKAIVDFVLRDSRENDADKPQKKLPEYRQELEVVPKPWHNSFERGRYELSKNLHSINPCMSQVLVLWYSSFRWVSGLVCCWNYEERF